MEQLFHGDEIRSIILTAHKIREFNKCPNCKGSGWENWNGETGGDIKAGRLSEYDSVRSEGECENCDGVGYTHILMYGK